jgi:hypothetical protein
MSTHSIEKASKIKSVSSTYQDHIKTTLHETIGLKKLFVNSLLQRIKSPEWNMYEENYNTIQSVELLNGT